MGASLEPCPSCARHVRVDETSCPFCSATMPEGFGARSTAAPEGPALTRAAILFVGAAAVAGCSSSSTPNPMPMPLYGPAPVDGSVQDAPYDGPVALYGPAPVDAGADSPLPAPADGPGPVRDAGNG